MLTTGSEGRFQKEKKREKKGKKRKKNLYNWLNIIFLPPKWYLGGAKDNEEGERANKVDA